VRSALLSVKGVTRAQVRLEEHEAIVTYDPATAKIEDMIKAVGEAEGPDGPKQYKASVKKEKPASS
jgi:copper chaperone CopZ